MNILIISPSLSAGGAEKSAIKLSKGLQDNPEHQVYFGTYFSGKSNFYEFPDFIKNIEILENFNKNLKFKLLYPYFILIDAINFRKYIIRNKIDTTISFGAGTGCLTFLFLIGHKKVKQITSERTNPDLKVYKPSLLAQLLRPFIYNKGVLCTVQTLGIKKYVEETWGIKSYLTPNHFEFPESFYSNTDKTKPLVAIGSSRLEKGLFNLLSAWEIISTNIPNELFLIIDFKDLNLIREVKDLNLSKIRLFDLHQDLNSIYKECSTFISVSSFEGFPNALTEALIYGIPSISTPSSDIVVRWQQLKICGFIDNSNSQSIAHSILNFLDHWHDSLKFLQNSRLELSEYSWETVSKMWQVVLRDANKK